MTRDPIRAITFDFWNTLVRATDEQGTWRMMSWVERLAARGHRPSTPAVVREAFVAEWRRTTKVG